MEDIAMDASDNSAKPKTSILDLNEDCLTEISQYLDFKDLTTFFKTHDHFHNAIERVVAGKIFTFEIFDYEYSYCKDMKAILIFLVLFGKQLRGLKIKLPAHYNQDHDKELVPLVQDNIETLIETCCANGNIKHLTLENFYLSKYFIRDEDGIVINSLRSLKIVNIKESFQDLFELLLCSQNVKKLNFKINNFEDINYYLDLVNFHQLESLRLLDIEAWPFLKAGDLINFERLPISLSMKRLEIPYRDCDPSLLVKHFPNLEYLKFGTSTKYSLQPLLNLPKLKHFSLIYCEEAGEHVAGLLNALGNRNELETPKLQKPLPNNKNYLKNETVLLKEVYKMTNLRELALDVGPACKHHLKEIALNLKELQRLTLNFDRVDHSKELIPKILEFVKLAEKLERLTLTITVSLVPCEDNVNIPKLLEELEKIRCSKRSEKVLRVNLMVKPFFYIYRNFNRCNLNFQGKYVKSSRRILHTSDCDCYFEEDWGLKKCGGCGKYREDPDYH